MRIFNWTFWLGKFCFKIEAIVYLKFTFLLLIFLYVIYYLFFNNSDYYLFFYVFLQNDKINSRKIFRKIYWMTYEIYTRSSSSRGLLYNLCNFYSLCIRQKWLEYLIIQGTGIRAVTSSTNISHFDYSTIFDNSLEVNRFKIIDWIT